ncbi:MAG TPA: glucose-1-phosphate thymidylyltransferase, partial [Flavobacteriaceae bacterium]|nr:glucose-1-phosphate thymidylyltransferase [Flavobacteriaceae bacterium]
EYEITEVNKSYLKDGALSVVLLDPGFTWLDTGTFAALSEASQFVEVLENRQGQLIGAPEWAAFQAGFIDADQLSALATPLMRSGYGQQLLKALNSYGAR